MSKFVKTILIISAVLVGVGIVCVAVAAGMGVTVKDLRDPINERVEGHIEHLDKLDDIDGFEAYLDISSDDGIHLDVESSESTVGGFDASEVAVQERFEDVVHLHVEAGAGQVEIRRDDVEAVELRYGKGTVVRTEMEERELEIECGGKGGEGLAIVIPRDLKLHDVDLDFGAGQIIMNDISFVELEADVGAGQLIVYAPGNKTDYNYEIDYGIGVVAIGDEQFVGIGSHKVNNGVKNKIDIDCGAGSVEVHFLGE